MVQDIKLVAIVLVLAALVYILYLWSKRKDQIPCPSCGARVDIYAEECPHCGHKKGEPVDEEDEAADVVSGSTVRDTVAGPKESGLDGDEGPDGPERPEEPEPVGARDETDADVDYEDVVQGTIPEVKQAVREEGLDPQRVLEAEKADKDRVTLKDWLEEQLARQ